MVAALAIFGKCGTAQSRRAWFLEVQGQAGELAARGKRLIGQAGFGHCNTMTFIAALRPVAITAPWAIDVAPWPRHCSG